MYCFTPIISCFIRTWANVFVSLLWSILALTCFTLLEETQWLRHCGFQMFVLMCVQVNKGGDERTIKRALCLLGGTCLAWASWRCRFKAEIHEDANTDHWQKTKNTTLKKAKTNSNELASVTARRVGETDGRERERKKLVGWSGWEIEQKESGSGTNV